MIILRKGLIIVSGIIIVLAVLTNLFLPSYTSFLVRHYLQSTVKAQQVEGSVQTKPAFMILTGRLDEIDYTASGANFGQVQVGNLSLKGKDLHISLPELLTGHLKIEKVGNLQLSGTIDESELQELIAKKISKAKNVKVNITPEAIDVNASIPLFENSISAHLVGQVYTSDGNIYFRTQRMDVENNFLGRITLNKMENILLINKERLPFGAKIFRIEQENGQILVEAGMSKE